MSPTLLHVNASAQSPARSYTRRLGEIFLAKWRDKIPSGRITTRDLAADPVPQVTADWIAAAFTRPENRTAEMAAALRLSDTLIAEISAADVIVLGAPMYNYGMPAALKAWVDQVARIGETFSFDLGRGDYPIEPMLHDKTLVVLSSRGEFGFAPGGPRAHLNALDPAIAACAHYLGVAAQDIHTVTVEYQEFKDERHRASLAAAEAQAAALATGLARIWAPAATSAGSSQIGRRLAIRREEGLDRELGQGDFARRAEHGGGR
jgi:FMN-dependent NADH-azoreductase